MRGKEDILSFFLQNFKDKVMDIWTRIVSEKVRTSEQDSRGKKNGQGGWLSRVSGRQKKGTDGDSELSNLKSRRTVMPLSEIMCLQGGVGMRSPVPPLR